MQKVSAEKSVTAVLEIRAVPCLRCAYGLMITLGFGIISLIRKGMQGRPRQASKFQRPNGHSREHTP